MLADAGLALETVEEDGVGFDIGVRNLEGDDAVVAQVGGAVDGGHSAAGYGGLDAVGIELGTGFQGVVKSHRRSLLHSGVLVHFIGKWGGWGKESISVRGNLAEVVPLSGRIWLGFVRRMASWLRYAGIGVVELAGIFYQRWSFSADISARHSQ